MYTVLYIFGGICGYSFIVVLLHRLCHGLTNWDDSDSWVVGGFWPVTLPIFVSWLVVHKLPIAWKAYFNRRTETHRAKRKAIKDKYKHIKIPKKNVDNLGDYRDLGRLSEEIREKLQLYEKTHKMPVEERCL